MDSVGVFGVVGVGECVEECGVAGCAADVFGWAGAAAVDTAWVAHCGLGGGERGDGQGVVPVVAEVVDVVGFLPDLEELGEGDGLLVVGTVAEVPGGVPVRVGDAVAGVVDGELVQVGASPTPLLPG